MRSKPVRAPANCKILCSLQELCQKLHEQVNISEEERYSIEFKLNMVLNEVSSPVSGCR